MDHAGHLAGHHVHAVRYAVSTEVEAGHAGAGRQSAAAPARAKAVLRRVPGMYGVALRGERKSINQSII